MLGAGGMTRLVGSIIAAALSGAAAVEHLHFIRHDLGGVAVLAVLPLPLTGLQFALDVDLRAFAQILTDYFREAVEEHDAVKFRPLLALPGLLVSPRF